MKKRLISLVAILVVTAGCQPASPPMPPTPTPVSLSTPTVNSPTTTAAPLSTLILTIKENECALSGPSTVPHAVLTINLVMDEQKPTESGYALVTLKAGKTIEDLKAWPSAAQPDWVSLIHGVHEYNNGMHTYTYNYGNVTTDQTLYLACFRADPNTGTIQKIGAFGPIEVK